MTGPEHFLRAERLLAKAEAYDPEPGTARQASVCRTAALVHALLANAAASGLAAADPQAGLRTADAVAWEQAASAAPPDDEETAP